MPRSASRGSVTGGIGTALHDEFVADYHMPHRRRLWLAIVGDRREPANEVFVQLLYNRCVARQHHWKLSDNGDIPPT